MTDVTPPEPLMPQAEAPQHVGGLRIEQLDEPAVDTVAINVSPTALLQHCPEVVWVSLHDEVVVYVTATATSHVLNKQAGLLWQCFDGESRLDEILADISDVFETPYDVVLTDSVPVVAQWISDEMLEEVDDD